MPMATLPAVTCSHAYEDDLVTEAPVVQRGFMKVPEGPGLGVELAEAAVARYASTPAKEWPRHLSVGSFPGGVTYYLRRQSCLEEQPFGLFEIGRGIAPEAVLCAAGFLPFL